MKFCLYFLTTIKKGETYPHTPGTVEAHKWIWTRCLQYKRCLCSVQRFRRSWRFFQKETRRRP